MKMSALLVMAGLIALLHASADGHAAPAPARLTPGEYACSGSSGILIGLGFRLKADGTYTDLNGGSMGRVIYNGGSVSFMGGHLAGQVGRNIKGGTSFEMGSFACSRA
jgi:hypothetical protein